MSDLGERSPTLRALRKVRNAASLDRIAGLLSGWIGFFACLIVTAVVWRMLCPG